MTCRWCGHDRETEVHVLVECNGLDEERNSIVTAEGWPEEGSRKDRWIWMMGGGGGRPVVWDMVSEFLVELDNQSVAMGLGSLIGKLEDPPEGTEEAVGVLARWVEERDRREARGNS